MAPRPTRIIRAALVQKGFVQQEDSSHQAFVLFVDGEKKKVHTHYSHGARECDDYILGLMSRQLLLSRSQLNALIDCQMSGEEYVTMLKERGEL
jgi:hypothetical protein